MNALLPFQIPYSGLKVGMHEFDMQVDDYFFACIENGLVQRGKVDVSLFIDKRSSFCDFVIQLNGEVEVPCDRCLDPFFKQVEGEFSMVFKFTEDHATLEEDADIAYFPAKVTQLDVSSFVYEFIVLSIPTQNMHEDEDLACDDNVIRYLNKHDASNNTPSDEPLNNPFKDLLGNIE